jgi:hypothetical protein
MALDSDLVASLKGAHPNEFLTEIMREERPKFGLRWPLRNEIAPSDLYSYLGARFGAPNGLQNFLRKNDSDNLIHWEWTLRCGEGWVTFQGMNFRTDVWITANAGIADADKIEFVSQLKADFANYGKKMSEVRKALENWVEFVNPYQRIKKSVDKLLLDLRELNLRPEDEAIPDITDAEKIPDDRWVELFGKYSQGLGLCFGIRSMLPVMAEAFVNLILFVFMRVDLKSDERLRENIIRQPIDVRVKSLHINCTGFDRPIDYSHDACKAYHSLVNERNDLLHGNVVLDKLKFNEVFFNGRVPVFKQYRSMWERSVGVEIQSVGLHRLEREVRTINSFTAYLKSCMKEEVRAQFEYLAEMRDLGLNSEDGRIGILFPSHLADILPVFSNPQEVDS